MYFPVVREWVRLIVRRGAGVVRTSVNSFCFCLDDTSQHFPLEITFEASSQQFLEEEGVLLVNTVVGFGTLSPWILDIMLLNCWVSGVMSECGSKPGARKKEYGEPTVPPIRRSFATITLIAAVVVAVHYYWKMNDGLIFRACCTGTTGNIHCLQTTTTLLVVAVLLLWPTWGGSHASLRYLVLRRSFSFDYFLWWRCCCFFFQAFKQCRAQRKLHFLCIHTQNRL